MAIVEIGDADGHLIEPGDLWVQRMPKDLRDQAPHFYRDEAGVFHQRIYGLDIADLPAMHGGISPKDMLDNMGLACAMGVPLERVFATADQDRHTILEASDWTKDGAKRLAFNVDHGVGRAVLFPSFMLVGGSLFPNIAADVCRVYNDWVLKDYCAGSGGRLIPVAAVPMTDVEAAVAEVRRVAELGFPAVFVRTNAVYKTKLSDRSFDPLWEIISETGLKLGLHPLPMWDQEGASLGYNLRDIMAASALGFPMDMMYTLYDMMSGAVFDRFPFMQTMILESGVGWIPPMFERWEEHRELFGSVKAPDWKTPPMEIFERQMMVTIEACEETDLRIALEFLPADHVAVASDWPHYDGTPGLLDGFREATKDIDPGVAELLATGTLERWFPPS
jgi:predicted TIM-barrel fold metal-dependent hydrolase